MSSCLELIDDVTFNENGSGQIKLTLNLSKSKTQIEKLLQEDQINGVKIPSISTIDEHIAATVNTLNTTQGISEVSHSFDKKNYILKLNYSFSSIKTLNNSFNIALNTLIQKEQRISFPIEFRANEKGITKSVNADFIHSLDKELGGFGFMELGSSSLVSIFRFDSMVNSTSNSSTKISKSGKSTFTKLLLSEILDTPNKGNITVHLR